MDAINRLVCYLAVLAIAVWLLVTLSSTGTREDFEVEIVKKGETKKARRALSRSRQRLNKLGLE